MTGSLGLGARSSSGGQPEAPKEAPREGGQARSRSRSSSKGSKRNPDLANQSQYDDLTYSEESSQLASGSELPSVAGSLSESRPPTSRTEISTDERPSARLSTRQEPRSPLARQLATDAANLWSHRSSRTSVESRTTGGTLSSAGQSSLGEHSSTGTGDRSETVAGLDNTAAELERQNAELQHQLSMSLQLLEEDDLSSECSSSRPETAMTTASQLESGEACSCVTLRVAGGSEDVGVHPTVAAGFPFAFMTRCSPFSSEPLAGGEEASQPR
eukprot:CAMPEP_0195129554 /NCGR_PEP_ID=MMETSP0448-20130528/141403_1 /TAXON_ID=66468 /ORGANISM="Heterocapsa triquestra, Strain CCMP 448" /LENGTH=271 /DNA_ID=CAMNT_0040167407 /DNA_START=53 /DNA_END=866 /DNA_ORIENTATION=-